MSLVSGLLNQTLDYIYSVTTDGYGDKTKTQVYSSVPCRWWETEGRVYDEYMNLREYSIEVWLFPTYTINYDYIITQSSEDYRIVKIERRYDLMGQLDHLKLYLV